MPPRPPPSKRPAVGPVKEENTYIPQFITKRPFYAGEGEDTDYLEHQRLRKKHEDSAWYDRSKKGVAATKYRKGACENCGAMGHKAKDCLERPRKKGAKWTNQDIKGDDVVQDVQMSWDAKRDRWNGYDAKEHRQVVEEFEEMAALKKQLQKENKKSGEGADEEDEYEEDGENKFDEGDKYADTVDLSKLKNTTARQLRLREDTAKYLLNLDLESAKYDPKRRRLVDSGALADNTAELFKEEGFVRASGDATEFEKATRYAWEALDKTGDNTQHLQANPTAGEFYRKKEREEAEKKRLEREKALRDKYGEGSSTMPAALQKMVVTESEQFVEYDEYGLVKGHRASAKSKYPEDVHPNNHTSVFGSWWSNFQWGYECCHSTMKNSYCTGEDGKRAFEASERQRTGAGLVEGEDVIGEDEPPAEQKDQAGNKAKQLSREEMASGITEEEMDEYRRKRTVADDPMANFLGKDELVH